MANAVQLKRSTTPGNSPGSLLTGEIAINHTDRRLYINDNSGGSAVIKFINLTSDAEKIAVGQPIGDALAAKLASATLLPPAGIIALTTAAGAVTGTVNKYTHGGYIVNGDQVAQVSNGGSIGSKVDGCNILHYFGGSNAQGGRHAIEGNLVHTTATSANNADRNYVGVQGQAISQNGDGGASGSPKGQYFGLSASTIIQANATFVYNATGAEFNVVTVPGCSVTLRQGIQIADTIGVRGSAIDCAIGISCAQGSTLTNQNGIFFGNQNGAPALGSDSTAIYLQGSAIPQLNIFLDAPSVRFLTAIIRSPYVVLTEQALTIAYPGSSVILGNNSQSSTSIVDMRTSGTAAAYDVRLSANGGNSTAGNGVLTVTAALFIPPGLTRPGSRYGASLGAFNFEFNQIHAQNLVLVPQTSFAPTQPGQLTFYSADNNHISFAKMGSDSVVRFVDLTLSRQATFVDVSTASSQTIGSSYTKIVFSTVNSDSGGNWDSTNNWYTCPVSGVYQITGTLRISDSAASGSQFGVGVFTSEVDGPWYTWDSKGTATRYVARYSRLSYQNAGDKLRMFSYSDTSGGITTSSAGLQIMLISETR